MGVSSLNWNAIVANLLSSFCMGLFDIGAQMLAFSKSLGLCEESLKLLVDPYNIPDKQEAQERPITKGEIIFKDVSFQYDHQKHIFETINLLIPSGQKIGLVGASGGGKSTFIKLLLRLIDCTGGHIYIDGFPIDSFKKDNLRAQIATISQESELFHRTILENIKFGAPEASFKEVVTAAKKARCDDFINELREGYETLVGERGVKLSGGQRQRISIARALLKQTKILLLDEATSALDSVTEKQIQEALLEVMSDKTVIVVAHRLSTLAQMDRILVIEEGKIIEDGSFEELKNKTNGYFANMWKIQSSREELLK